MAIRSLRQLLQDFRGAKAKTEKLQNNLPRIIGTEGVKVIHENFDKQGYDTGTSFSAWPKRADATNAAYDNNRNVNATTIGYKTLKSGKLKIFRGQRVSVTSTGRLSRFKNKYAGSLYNGSNPLLLQTRTLYRAVNYIQSGQKVTIGVDPALAIYAEKMNIGGKGKWGKKAATNTPARKFMPTPYEQPSPKMLGRIKAKVQFEQNNAMAAFRK